MTPAQAGAGDVERGARRDPAGHQGRRRLPGRSAPVVRPTSRTRTGSWWSLTTVHATRPGNHALPPSIRNASSWMGPNRASPRTSCRRGRSDNRGRLFRVQRSGRRLPPDKLARALARLATAQGAAACALSRPHRAHDGGWPLLRVFATVSPAALVPQRAGAEMAAATRWCSIAPPRSWRGGRRAKHRAARLVALSARLRRRGTVFYDPQPMLKYRQHPANWSDPTGAARPGCCASA